MSTAKVKTAARNKPKFPVQVQQVIERINDKNIRLSMIEYSNLVHVLVSKYRIKPTVIEKVTDFSLPHIYNMISLGSMSPKMKSMVVTGKIKGTDALTILRKAKDEKEFLIYAYELADSKIDLRKVRDEQPVPSKQKTIVRLVDKKEKVKKLMMEIIGKDNLTKSKTNTLDSLITKLMAS